MELSRKNNRPLVLVWLLLSALLLAACDEDTSGSALTSTPPRATSSALTPRTSQPNPPNQSANPNPTIPGVTPPVPGTAVPFFTPPPGQAVSASPSGYSLTFEEGAATPIIEASFTATVPPDKANDEWQVVITGDGVARYTKNPRDKSRLTVEERFLNQEKQQELLQGLIGLGLLDWPDTTPPGGPDTTSRTLVLALKGRPKRITDLSGKTGDGLSRMLDLLRRAVEAAPLRNSP